MSLLTASQSQKQFEQSLRFKEWIDTKKESTFRVRKIVPKGDTCDLFSGDDGKIVFLIEDTGKYRALDKKEKVKAAQLVASNIASIIKKDMKVHACGSFYTNVIFKDFDPHLQVSLYALQDPKTGEMRHSIPVNTDASKIGDNPLFVVRICPHSGASF